MVSKLWKLKSIFLLLALLGAFAACVKERDPNLERNQIKDDLAGIVSQINAKSLSGLNDYFMQPVKDGKGPNALLAEVTSRYDSVFVMYKRRFSIDKDNATVRFVFTNTPEDSTFSFLSMEYDDGWKITDYELH